MHISSRSVSRGQVYFRLSRVANGVITLYPEDVPLDRLFDFITPEQLQDYEHNHYAVEEEQEKLRKIKRRGRPPGSKKKLNATGPSSQAESGVLGTTSSSKHTSSSVTSETDPLQRDSERDAIDRAPPPSSGQSISSTEASFRSSRFQQIEETEQRRYQMLPPTPQRPLQTVSRSPTTNPAPLKSGRSPSSYKTLSSLTDL
ncbi:MAG: hypothetical protein LQ347_003125 [Umbilicaria vellea]|nr:MAG: hypothetical protein LQ347_003125 [Umbilicaria vellea]